MVIHLKIIEPVLEAFILVVEDFVESSMNTVHCQVGQWHCVFVKGKAIRPEPDDPREKGRRWQHLLTCENRFQNNVPIMHSQAGHCAVHKWQEFWRDIVTLLIPFLFYFERVSEGCSR